MKQAIDIQNRFDFLRQLVLKETAKPLTSLDDEEGYWSFVRAWFRALLYRSDLEGTLRMTLGARERADDEILKACQQLLTVLDNRCCEHEDAYRVVRERPVAPQAPRILRLADAIDLSQEDLDILHYLVLSACDPWFGDKRDHKTDLGDVQSFFNHNSSALFRLLDGRSPLLAEQLLSLEERSYTRSPRQIELQIDPQVAKTLRGLPLSVEDCHAVVSDSLRGVLRQEPGVEKLFEDAAPAPKFDTENDANDEADVLESPIEEPFDVAYFLQQTAVEPDSISVEHSEIDPLELPPYQKDLDYLEDHIDWFIARYKWKKHLLDDRRDSLRGDDSGASSRAREAQTRERRLRGRIDARLSKTRAIGSWRPRGERLAEMRGLCDFEKHVLLSAAAGEVSMKLRRVGDGLGSAEVGEFLFLFLDDLEQQVRGRSYFYKSGRLIQDGLVSVSERSFAHDFLRSDVNVDRRMVDYLLGLETEAGSIIEGSHVYSPTVELDRVILEKAKKELIVKTVEQFPAFQKQRKRCGLDEMFSYGSGIVILFHGSSGTGKTMMANALGHHLQKKILLVNYPSIGRMSSDEALRFLFREAKINDAILFFDECEGIFEDRDFNQEISLILSELERHDGLVILATNRPYKLDEAMHRRITLAVEFAKPDDEQRERIWRSHIPPRMKLRDPIDFADLAYRFELTGGLIKNAVSVALVRATTRQPEDPVVEQCDFEAGAQLQIQRNLQMVDFADRVVPKATLTDLVLAEALQSALLDLVGMAKARKLLVNEWGLGRTTGAATGVSALFYGPPGTGKSLAAEAVAFELGRPMKLVDAGELLSKWVGESAKNIRSVFEDAARNEAVLVFDEADTLFAGRTAVATATDRYANLDVAVLLREIERYTGVVILTTNLDKNIDPAFRRRLRFVLGFSRPELDDRESLWRRHLPDKLPIAPDVSLPALAERFSLSGGEIRNAVLRAASRAARRGGAARVVVQHDLETAAAEELRSSDGRVVVGFGEGATRRVDHPISVEPK